MMRRFKSLVCPRWNDFLERARSGLKGWKCEVEQEPLSQEQCQALMDDAVRDYLEVSKLLRADIGLAAAGDLADPSARRNFVRTSVVLLEGYLHCYREMCLPSVPNVEGSTGLTRRQKAALVNPDSMGAAERTKHTLGAVYSRFNLPDRPNYCGKDWKNAKKLFAKRSGLIHPKSPVDLDISEDLWDEIYWGTVWLFEVVFGVIEKLHARGEDEAEN